MRPWSRSMRGLNILSACPVGVRTAANDGRPADNHERFFPLKASMDESQALCLWRWTTSAAMATTGRERKAKARMARASLAKETKERRAKPQASPEMSKAETEEQGAEQRQGQGQGATLELWKATVNHQGTAGCSHMSISRVPFRVHIFDPQPHYPHQGALSSSGSSSALRQTCTRQGCLPHSRQ